jgi:phosphatidylglycerophosphatase GEP4
VHVWAAKRDVVGMDAKSAVQVQLQLVQQFCIPLQPASIFCVQERTLMQRLGQSFNSAGIALFARVALVCPAAVIRSWGNTPPPLRSLGCTAACPLQSDQPLSLPHLSVADLRWIDWPALKAAGFHGCVFDKDNTLTGSWHASPPAHPLIVGRMVPTRGNYFMSAVYRRTI